MSEITGKTYGDVSEYQSDSDLRRLKVLVPLDGSATAERAIAYLPTLAALGVLDPKLVAVVDDQAGSVPGVDAAANEGREIRLLESYLRTLATKLSEKVPSVEFEVKSGNPAAAILEEAAAFRPDVLLISTHGRSGIQRWRLGSVADKVIRETDCNTLVVGPNAFESSQTVKSILLPLDGSGLAEAALPVARKMAEGLNARLHIVRVIEPQYTYTDPQSMAYSPVLFEAIEEEAKRYIESLKERIPGIETSMPFGPAAGELIDYIEANRIELVIMTSHGRGGLMRAAFGSVTDRLIGGPAAVFVVHPRADHEARS